MTQVLPLKYCPEGQEDTVHPDKAADVAPEDTAPAYPLAHVHAPALPMYPTVAEQSATGVQKVDPDTDEKDPPGHKFFTPPTQ